MRRLMIGCLSAFVAALAAAGPAAADTLAPREGPFGAAQAPADQYTTPTPIAPPPASQPASGGEEGAARGGGEEGAARGGAGDRAGGGTAPTSQGLRPAEVDGATAAPPKASGTLPFTGRDLLALVWIALALIVAGTAGEVLRRRIEARRA